MPLNSHRWRWFKSLKQNNIKQRNKSNECGKRGQVPSIIKRNSTCWLCLVELHYDVWRLPLHSANYIGSMPGTQVDQGDWTLESSLGDSEINCQFWETLLVHIKRFNNKALRGKQICILVLRENRDSEGCKEELKVWENCQKTEFQDAACYNYLRTEGSRIILRIVRKW